MLDQIQQRAVLYFWQQAAPMTGLVKDRANNFGAEDYTVASIAATGFGLAGLAIGESRGWLTYDEAYERTLATLRYLRDDMPQEHGFYYHFVDTSTGQRVWESEVSSDRHGLALGRCLDGRRVFQRHGGGSHCG